MKKLVMLGLLLVAAGCSVLEPHEDAREEQAGAGAAQTEAGSLVVPPLSALPETAPRALRGHYKPASWADLPAWGQDDAAGMWKALLQDCRGLMRPVGGSLALPARAAPRVWQPFCSELAASGLGADSAPALVREFLQARLRPWLLTDGAGRAALGTATGYYEPIIRASQSKQGGYEWPLYATPDDLLVVDLGEVYPELAGKRVRGKLQGRRVVPYDTRAQIAADGARQPPVIVWADDPIEAFFLQIQGSGRALLPDGKVLRLAYDDHNGRPYVSIGKWLAEQGAIPLAQASMQRIKAWARANPARVPQLLAVNPAMVFFRAEAIPDPELGPKGAYGVPLVAERAVAVDPDFVPLGTPVFLQIKNTAGAVVRRRLVFAQDTGAAIRGAARVDYYWGSGEQAGEQAGRMKHTSQLWLLWPAAAGAPQAR